MLRSLYSGISGMKSNQVKLDVVGNNVSNVGTTGFKYSRVRFQDMLSQSQKMSSAPSRYQGGVNPGQVGLGVQVSGIDTIVTQGMMQPTGRNLDVAMDGSGYFMVARGSLPTSATGGVSIDNKTHEVLSGNGMTISYTRDGALALDEDGNLLTSDGYRMLGYVISEKTGLNTNARSVNYDKNGVCEYIDADSKGGLQVGASLVPMRIPDSVFVNGTKIDAAEDMLYTGTGIKDSNKADPTIKTSDKFIGNKDVKLEIKTFTDTTGSSPEEKFAVYANGEKITVLDNDKSIFVTPEGKVSATDPTGIRTEITITKPGYTEESKFSWEYTLSAEGPKKIRNFFIEKEGLVKGVLEDGKVSVLGQLAVASFKNAEGLQKLGKNLYTTSSNSGQPIIRSGIGADEKFDNSKGYGDVLNGVLEMSNVELTEQFTEMIVTTRAFQASSKMISTGDEILQEIINLKR
ncbi:flagellar hook protein FlgE [Oceanirhabdus sp. W0125-5]|uniref:flagellar hook protein FlgE n=1 Tax=Oceanirhabdus sp. W0125-5 TaxID=2999116 RepID=UPI0022F2CA7B|nr:flagellar hook-basal body complex protein [Oceanirhabdus sp. W0125-5]WBW95423.1 flagellar hook-basal body complex protein [Oceanirhabdus sp. W0125-5]